MTPRRKPRAGARPKHTQRDVLAALGGRSTTPRGWFLLSNSRTSSTIPSAAQPDGTHSTGREQPSRNI